MKARGLTIESEAPEQLLLMRLKGLLTAYLEPEHIEQVFQAYQFGKKYHTGQFRKTGEPYICHPLSVAIILAKMRMDVHGITAAILHDLIEDTEVSKEDIDASFGKDVAELVDGVTKLTQLNHKTQAETQAENVRKMCLAMAKDLRVIMVKLADRLHNMQTLGVMRPQKKRRIAKETLDIYTPLANRLGMNSIRHQLESLSFVAMYPIRHRVLRNAVKKASGNRKEIIETIIDSIKTRLHQAQIMCDVEGREKYLYSIYKKMQSKGLPFSDIFDVYAFRIYCVDVDTCYRVLGVVHNLFKPVPGKFKDYIALPKANGYQSIHTVLIGPYGVPVEIQIRTAQMHRMSESGIAAHWLYKSENGEHSTPKTRATEWVHDLLEQQKCTGNSLEFIDNLKVDLFPQDVFVFTPKGNIIKLPRDASVVDFAYAVHTDIGNACVSGRIDKRLVPLQTPLDNGVTVEVITASWARPNPLWLNYVVTTKARTGIRTYLKHFQQQEAIDLGRRLLEKELIDMGVVSLSEITEQMRMELLGVLNYIDFDGLLEDIGLGNKMPFLIAKQLSQEDISAVIKLGDAETRHETPLMIKGTEGMVITLAKCCRPIPGDPIVGCFNAGKGIVVHHPECRNSSDERKRSAEWLEVEWSKEVSGDYLTEIRIELLNQRGTLATIASAISSMDSNIEKVQIVDQDAQISIDMITLSVKDRVHLASVLRQLKKLSIILKITRAIK